MGLSLKLLGDFAVGDEAGKPLSLPTRKTRALLAYLAVNADKPQQRERLMALLWSDRGEQQARHSLNQALMSIRRLGNAAAVPLLVGDGERVTLLGDAVESDIAKFQGLLADDPAAAVALYEGPFLDGLTIPDPAFEEWLAATRADLHSRACDALVNAAKRATDDADRTAAIDLTRQLVAFDPLREDGHRRLMTLLRESGDRAGALRQYQVCADILKKELQVEPDTETKVLYEEIRKDQSATGASEAMSAQEASPSETPPTLPDKPSIAVLPFANLSGDPEQEYFADGMTEDIVTELSRFEDLFVISSNSTFTYKGKRIEAKIIAHELGVHFILEGSVRKVGQQVRIAAQLINGHDSSHVWAERYDGVIENVFELQEEVASQVVGSILPEVTRSELERIGQGEHIFDAAHDIAWRANGMRRSAMRQRDPSMLDRALAMAAEAVSMNEKCGVAYQVLCLGYAMKNLFRWGENPETASDIAEDWAKKYFAHQPNSYMAYCCLGIAAFRKGNFQDANRYFRRAHDLNCNDSFVLRYWAWCEASAGEFESAQKHAHSAIRLSPKDSQVHVAYLALATATFITDDTSFEEWANRSIQGAPFAPMRRALMIAHAAEIEDEALLETHRQELMRTSPGFISSILQGENRLYEKPEHMAKLVQGLRKANFS